MNTDILNELKNAQNDTDREWAIFNFSIQNLDSYVRETAWISAIPNFFDFDLLNAISDHLISKEQFEIITNLSFVEYFPGRGFNIHERTRNLIIFYMWKQHPEKFKAVTAKIIEYYRKFPINNNIIDFEKKYHLAILNPSIFLQELIEKGNYYCDNRLYGELENLILPMMNNIKKGIITGEIAAWVQYFKARIDIDFFQYGRARYNLHIAIFQHYDNLNFTSICLYYIGYIHFELKEYDCAITCYKKSKKFLTFSKKREWLRNATCLSAIFMHA